MPPSDASSYIRALQLTVMWTAIMDGTAEEIQRVCHALNAIHVQIEREIEDCIDNGLVGKKIEAPNTRVRIEALTDALQVELHVHVTFGSLLPETREQVMEVARKVAECTSEVLRSRSQRIDPRVIGQWRSVRQIRPPAQVVPVQADKPAQPPPSSPAIAPSPLITFWLIANTFISLLALMGVILLVLLRQP